jgi:hypothetical protein
LAKAKLIECQVVLIEDICIDGDILCNVY